MSDKDLNDLLESALCDNHVEDNGFSQRVVGEWYRRPRVAFLFNLCPMLGFVAGLALCFWLPMPWTFSADMLFAPLINTWDQLNSVASSFKFLTSFGLLGVAVLAVGFLFLKAEEV